MGAVGKSQFVVFLNGRIRTFNKATGVAAEMLRFVIFTACRTSEVIGLREKEPA